MSERENLENGLRKAARITKKILRNPITRRVVIVVATIALIIVLCGSAYESLMDAFSNKVSEHVKNNPVQYNTSDNSIIIADETIDNLIKLIEDMGIDMESLHISREHIAKFYAAEVVSSEINRGGRQENGKYYGKVFVKSQNPNTGNLESLTFEPDLAKFEAMSAPDILKYFSMEGDKICIASTQTSTDKDGNTTSNIHIDKLSYKDNISQYTVPIEFLLDLCLITQNPNFVLALADKIINETEIVIEVLQETTTTNTTSTYNYKTETETSTKTENYNKDGVLIGSPVINTSNPIISQPQEETVSTSITRVNSTIKVQSVKNWIMEATNSYNKVINEPTEPDKIGPVELEDEEKGTHQYTKPIKKVNKDQSYTLTYTSTITRKVEQTTLDTIATTSETYQEGTSSGVKDKVDEFIEMLKTPYLKIGSSRTEAPIHNLKNGDEMFFQMLQNGSRTQLLEKLMRYILGKATGNNYGISEFDFSTFDIKQFTKVSGIYGSTVQEKVWFSLLNAGYSKYAAAGVLGNIWAESGFASNNLENSSNNKSGLSDEEFTNLVNEGTITRDEFIKCEKYSTYSKQGWIYGYGLAQWTSAGRKQGLYDFAKSKGVSIDDVNMQVEYILAEITGTGADGFAGCQLSPYKGYTIDDWVNATSAGKAAEAFCWIFEKPGGWNSARATKAEEYYQLYKDRAIGGSYEENQNQYGVNGYYTASSGRRHTILNQHKINGWALTCNRAACAIIASGYSDESSTELINNINNVNRSLYGAIPPQGSEYWERYGLAITSFERNPSDHVSKLRNQLSSGGYALLWIKDPNSTDEHRVSYYGKSGIKWTGSYHWVAVIDYKYDNGTDQMCIADYRGITWVELDEFEARNGVKCGVAELVFVNEK